MGNCIRRETGIEREEEDKVKREEMIMHIIKMKGVWNNRFKDRNTLKVMEEKREKILESLNRSDREEDEKIKYEDTLGLHEDEMMEAIRFNKSNMYKGEDPSKVMMNLSKAKRKYDEDSEPEDNKVIETNRVSRTKAFRPQLRPTLSSQLKIRTLNAESYDSM